MSSKLRFYLLTSLLIVGATFFSLFLTEPDRVNNISFEVREGESLYSVSERLEDDGIVRSALLFRSWVSLLKRDTTIGLGVYLFDKPLTLGGVISKFVEGPDDPLLSVTIPEGSTTKEIADLIAKILPHFSVDTFGELVHAKKLDGFLFPSTYYPLPSFTEADVIRVLNSTFEREYEKHFSEKEIPNTLSNRNDVISLAAILEGEANTEEDMKMVSGILQKRLQKGMRLQVDVAEVTYRKSGVPEQPVNNPGIVAIRAVFEPKDSPYFYYITGKDGRMYYAKTFEEHKKNIQKYLR